MRADRFWPQLWAGGGRSRRGLCERRRNKREVLDHSGLRTSSAILPSRRDVKTTQLEFRPHPWASELARKSGENRSCCATESTRPATERGGWSRPPTYNRKAGFGRLAPDHFGRPASHPKGHAQDRLCPPVRKVPNWWASPPLIFSICTAKSTGNGGAGKLLLRPVSARAPVTRTGVLHSEIRWGNNISIRSPPFWRPLSTGERQPPPSERPVRKGCLLPSAVRNRKAPNDHPKRSGASDS